MDPHTLNLAYRITTTHNPIHPDTLNTTIYLTNIIEKITTGTLATPTTFYPHDNTLKTQEINTLTLHNNHITTNSFRPHFIVPPTHLDDSIDLATAAIGTLTAQELNTTIANTPPYIHAIEQGTTINLDEAAEYYTQLWNPSI